MPTACHRRYYTAPGVRWRPQRHRAYSKYTSMRPDVSFTENTYNITTSSPPEYQTLYGQGNCAGLSLRGGQHWDIVETQYDASADVWKQSRPFRNTTLEAD